MPDKSPCPRCMESDWAMFKACFVEVDAQTHSQKIICACCGSNLRTQWWTPVMKETIKLKKAAFQAWLDCGFGGHRSKITFGWPQGSSDNSQTTKKGKAGLASGCVQQGKRTGDPDWRYCQAEPFEELLNPTNMSSTEEAEFESGEAPAISLRPWFST